MAASHGVWTNQSAQWNCVRPPLRPCREGHKLIEQIVHEAASKNGGLRALVLGVTPEMARLN